MRHEKLEERKPKKKAIHSMQLTMLIHYDDHYLWIVRSVRQRAAHLRVLQRARQRHHYLFIHYTINESILQIQSGFSIVKHWLRLNVITVEACCMQ